MSLTDWGKFFPGLTVSTFKLTSPDTISYNCIAWAAGDNARWWEPDANGLWFWPDGATRKYTLKAYQEAFATLGYKRCANPTLEAGFEKIAIYVNTKPEHAARQLANGFWTSKLGQGDDVEHTLDGLNGSIYGHHKVYMKRPLVLSI